MKKKSIKFLENHLTYLVLFIVSLGLMLYVANNYLNKYFPRLKLLDGRDLQEFLALTYRDEGIEKMIIFIIISFASLGIGMYLLLKQNSSNNPNILKSKENTHKTLELKNYPPKVSQTICYLWGNVQNIEIDRKKTLKIAAPLVWLIINNYLDQDANFTQICREIISIIQKKQNIKDFKLDRKYLKEECLKILDLLAKIEKEPNTEFEETDANKIDYFKETQKQLDSAAGTL